MKNASTDRLVMAAWDAVFCGVLGSSLSSIILGLSWVLRLAMGCGLRRRVATLYTAGIFRSEQLLAVQHIMAKPLYVTTVGE